MLPTLASLFSICLRFLPLTPNSFHIGQSQYISAPLPARLNFDLDHIGGDIGFDDQSRIEDPDARLMSMLATQDAHRREVEQLEEDEDAIAEDPKLSDNERKLILQKALSTAASNGDADRVQRILDGKARPFVDVDKPDEEGTSPLIYASCFVSGVPRQPACMTSWLIQPA